MGKETLSRKINVIVDKPITLKLKQTNDLIKLSKANKKLLQRQLFSFHVKLKKLLNLLVA